MRLAAALIAVATLAGCETGPKLAGATVPVTLPATMAGAGAATTAMLPKLVEDYCLARLLDGAHEDAAVAKLGLVKAVNPLHGPEPRFPAQAWSSAATPRLFVFPAQAGENGCTIAVFEGDMDAAIVSVLTTAEAGRQARSGAQNMPMKNVPTYEDVRAGWRTVFSTSRDAPINTIYISKDNPDPKLARGVVISITSAS